MRIAFMGKGGSGKTSFSSAFITYCKKHKSDFNLIALDGDINAHLLASQGGDATKFLGNMQSEIIKYFCENRNDIDNRHIISTVPPTEESRFVRVSLEDPFIQKFGDINNGIPYCTVGTFNNDDLGKSCYHGKLEAFNFLYNHLLDGENDIVITDSMAGLDNLGTSNYFVQDAIIFVIEPTSKSLAVYNDFLKATKGEISHRVVINKLYDESDLDFVHQSIPKKKIIGYVKCHDPAIRVRERGDIDAIEDFVDRHINIFTNIFNFLSTHKRDRNKYITTLRKVHKNISEERYNDYLGTDLPTLGNQTFSYHSVL